MGIYEKLLDVRKSVDYIQKTERGNQGAMYVDPAALVKKIRDKMNDLGLILTPALHDAAVESIPMPTKNNSGAMGFLFRSPATYTFVDTDSGEKLEIPWFVTGKHGQDPAMAGGAALTYFERYFLLKFFQIPTAQDDPEHFKQKTAEPEPMREITIGAENVAWLVGFCKRHEITNKEDKKQFQDHYGFNPYGTSADEFGLIKAKIQADYNEAA